MVKRIKNALLLTPEQFQSSDPNLKIVGVFNPGVALYKGEIVLCVRIAEGVIDEKPGFMVSPRLKVANGKVSYSFEKVAKVPELARLPFVSHLEIVRLSKDGYTVKSIEKHPQLFGTEPFEEYGVEDPRITQIGSTYYMTYVAVSSSLNVCTALMSTQDFKTFKRHGVIFPCENKDVIIHPEKFGGLHICYHRPVPKMQFSKPLMVSATSPDLIHWGHHRLFLATAAQGTWMYDRIGGGTPPIKTKRGWLQIFHGVSHSPETKAMSYQAGAVLTSLEDPACPIAYSKRPILSPEMDFEKSGYVSNVVFPTGWVRDLEDEDKVILYYGCADLNIAAVTMSIQEILETLEDFGGHKA